MDMPVNKFKALLKEGRRQIGIWNTLPEPAISEIFAVAGFDWILIDTEHSPLMATDTLPILRSVAQFDISAIVRPGWNDAIEIKKLLDMGAQSILVPFVENASEAEAAVSAVRYPPFGTRGVSGSSRSSMYGAVKGYAHKAMKETCLIVQIETIEAASRVEEIASVEGVDAVFVGPADLAASMGHLGNSGHPDVRAAIRETIQRITAAGKPAGFLSPDDEMVQLALDAGASFVAVDLDVGMLRRAAAARLERWT